jgi:2-polyprenyl-3-methyl-5-hydroxy-6-metoxy-1,4-benzoquinol methylase
MFCTIRRAIDHSARWREALDAWAIPEEILVAAPESPWGFATELFRRRAESARAGPETPSRRCGVEVLPMGGRVLDVGAGAGAASLPLAPPASRIVAVDESKELLSAFEDLAAAAGVPLEAVAGRWPDVAQSVSIADVVVCHHVLYNVRDLKPFARALSAHARCRIVVEVTEEHPFAWMRDLWWRFHRLPRPYGPTASDAIDALLELGMKVRRVDFEEPVRAGGFRRREDAVAFVRKRLCLSAKRDPEVAESLGDRLAQNHEGHWITGPRVRRLVTMWWDP